MHLSKQKCKGLRVMKDRLREERQRLKLTQPQFGELAGVKKRTIVAWEKGETTPSSVHLSALSAAGVDVLYLLGGVRTPGDASQAEDAHMLRDAALREPGGEGPYHDLLRQTMRRKSEHYAQRMARLEPIIDRLTMCSDADFALVEAMIARIFGDAATPPQKAKKETTK